MLPSLLHSPVNDFREFKSSSVNVTFSRLVCSIAYIPSIGRRDCTTELPKLSSITIAVRLREVTFTVSVKLSTKKPASKSINSKSTNLGGVVSGIKVVTIFASSTGIATIELLDVSTTAVSGNEM